MRNFVLTVYIPDETPIRDSVFIAQMLREAAATLNYQVPLQDHHHVYGPAGAHKYEWTVSDPAAPIATLPSLRDQAVLDISGGVQSSAAVGVDTRYVRIVSEVRAAIRVGGTATSANLILSAGVYEYFGVQPGAVISVIAVP